jgi:hypothetical protein
MLWLNGVERQVKYGGVRSLLVEHVICYTCLGRFWPKGPLMGPRGLTSSLLSDLCDKWFPASVIF